MKLGGSGIGSEPNRKKAFSKLFGLLAIVYVQKGKQNGDRKRNFSAHKRTEGELVPNVFWPCVHLIAV